MTIANWVTLLRFIIAMAGAFLLGDGQAQGCARVATALFVLAIALDKVDGVVARKFDCCTAFGKFFDTALDKIVLAVYFLCLLDLKIVNRHLVAAALVRDMLTQGFRSYAESRAVFTGTDALSYTRYVIQCTAVISGLLSVGFTGTSQAGPLRQLSVLSFVTGVALGYWTLLNLLARHWREVVSAPKH